MGWLKDIHQVGCFPSFLGVGLGQGVILFCSSFHYVPSYTKKAGLYLGIQQGCRVPPGWPLPDRICPWSWGTVESAAASQGLPQGQGSSGSRRTRMSRVSNLVSLKGKPVV